MCGILGYLGTTHQAGHLQTGLQQLRHRGPDDSRIEQVSPNVVFGFVRLAIMDLSPAGMQPMRLTKDSPALVCNGEIYNYRSLVQQHGFTMNSSCDCEVLLHLYRHFNHNIAAVCQSIDAEFAFLLYDNTNDTLYAARDFGIRPLFYAKTAQGIYFASEAKGIIPYLLPGDRVMPFPPHCWWSSKQPDSFQPYYVLPSSIDHLLSPDRDLLDRIRHTLTESVKSRLMSDRSVGFFLSGGLDSSLVVAIASKLLDTPLQTFSIGFSESPDLVAARKVAQFCGTHHTEVLITFEEAFSAIEAVIRADETFDTTTIRASVPQYLLTKYIVEHSPICVLLSGEGADELEYGYLMWHQAPSLEEAQRASRELCEQLYMYDCLRCDRTTSAFSVEVRVPFLAKPFVDLMMKIPAEYKMPQLIEGKMMEKLLVRRAFDPQHGAKQAYLPEEVLYRTKAAFSDAVGLSWVDQIKARIETLITDEEFRSANYSHCPPRTKEELYYRRIFERYYPNQGALIRDFWKLRWQNGDDPSARYLKCYTQD